MGKTFPFPPPAATTSALATKTRRLNGTTLTKGQEREEDGEEAGHFNGLVSWGREGGEVGGIVKGKKKEREE